MAKPLTIALDVMGGDDAPRIVIEGAEMALSRDPGLRFMLYGDEHKFKHLLANAPLLKARSEVFHTDLEVGMDEKPGTAVRKRKSSMGLAIEAAVKGGADCCVSAGNTGALMGMSTIRMRTLAGIERPAIASVFPNVNDTPMVMLDLGANVVCDVDNLAQFAVMGALYARHCLGVENPTIGLLNIGAEQMKGNEVVRGAAERLSKMKLPGEFIGFIEGNDIGAGKVNVVVTDGFSGNIALKTAEGVSRMYGSLLKQSFNSSILSMLGALLARPALNRLKGRMDSRRHNGAMFLGLHGICVKSHGGTDAFGYCNAIMVARDLVKQNFNQKIVAEMEKQAYAEYDDYEDDDAVDADAEERAAALIGAGDNHPGADTDAEAADDDSAAEDAAETADNKAQPDSAEDAAADGDKAEETPPKKDTD